MSMRIHDVAERAGPRAWRLGVAVAVLCAICACAGPAYVDRSEGEPGVATKVAFSPVEFEVKDAFHERPPRCLAILPLQWVGEDDDGSGAAHAERVRRALYGHLAPMALRDVELREIDALLERLPAAARRDTRALGQHLDCDTLLLGTVSRFDERFFGVYSNAAVGAELELVRARNGDVLWEGRHVAQSHGGAVPTSPLDLVSGVVSALGNIGGEQLDRLSDDLARRLARTIPEPDAAVVTSPPATALPSAAPALLDRLAPAHGPGADPPHRGGMQNVAAIE